MKTAVWLCSLIMGSVLTLSAQDITGNIGGTILDPSGAAVGGAKVTLTNTERNQVMRVITTDSTGSYSAPLLPVSPQGYTIKVEAKGFKTESRTKVILNVSDDLRQNFTLTVGAVTETVEVVAE